MRHIQFLVVAALSCHFGTSAFVHAQNLRPADVFFENQVRPLLIEKCQECHGSDLQESGLRLDNRDYVLRGGMSGPAAVAKNLDDSLLIQAITDSGDVAAMPPEEPLSPAQINVLKRWVRMGLPWPKEDNQSVSPSLGDQVAIKKAAETHWAFQPIGNPTPPKAIKDNPRHPVDAFIDQKLSEANINANESASRPTILRRLSFDLIGLPPTFDEVRRFVDDPRDDAVVVAEKTDELLASKHHGERWARYWLDIARYADTRDWQAQAELRYPYAYTYRDYVIDALNNDTPYDDFVRQQIAADLYTDDESAPELAALGLLTVGPRFRNNRLEQAADQIDVVCRGLMGVTVSCARCHDHKYDPIPIEDYYSLYGVFASSELPSELPMIEGDEPPPELRSDFERKVAAKRKELADYKAGLRRDAIAALTKEIELYLRGFDFLSLKKQGDIRSAINKLKVSELAMTPLNNRLNRDLKTAAGKDDAVLAVWHDTLSRTEKQFSAGREKLIRSWKNDADLNQRVKDTIVEANPKTRMDVVTAYASVFQDVLDQWQDLQSKDKDADKMDEASAEQIRGRLIGKGSWFDFTPDEVAAASRLMGKGRKALGDREKAITEVESSHPGAPARAMVMVDREKPVTPFVLLRGEQARRGDRVPRQFPEFLAGKDRKPFRLGSGRRELAEAIVSPDNPLTARVLVNRIWARYFGRGLADSLDDFGLRSSSPSHPELLDHLAANFIANGWSMKWLHRTITTSDAYRRSSSVNEEAVAIDPENRLLWRQNRRRLDFEAMRDAFLSVAGELDTTIGGRSVKLSDEPFPTRRSVYAYVDRIELDPMLRTFDFASPTASAASRPETTIPQQALFCMNHPMVADQARQLAARASGTDENPQTTIQQLFRLTYQRDPSSAELSACQQFLSSADSTNVPSAVWQYGYGPVDTSDNADPALANEFVPFAHWTGSAYQISEAFPHPELRFLRLTSNTGHPGKSSTSGVIRRWTAPADGVIAINGTVKHAREKSDGIYATIRHGDVQIHTHVVRSDAKTVAKSIEVKRGDVVDFIASPGESGNADSHVWAVRLRGVGGSLKGQTWDSRADFAGPPPPALQPTAQLAQALMLANEFLFLD